MNERRPGITLFQLLLILALLAVMFAIFLPALIRARADALQQAKLNNLKMLVLGLHNYNDTFRFLPPGNDKFNFSVSAKLLPFIEQDNLYKQLNFEMDVSAPANAKIAAMPVKTFLSPNDPRMAVKDGFGATNYLFNAGTKPALVNNDGVFFQDSKSTIPNTFQDGTSNTFVVIETLKGDNGAKAEDVKRQHVQLDKESPNDLKDAAGVSDWKAGKNIAGDRCASWIDGRFLQGTFTATLKPNDERPDVNCAGLGGLSSARSLNDKIGVGFGDGSARLVKDSIDLKTWQALCTPAGGEVIPIDF